MSGGWRLTVAALAEDGRWRMSGGRRLTAAALTEGDGACRRERVVADVRQSPVDSGGLCGGRRTAADVRRSPVDSGDLCRGRTTADVRRSPVDSGGPCGGRRQTEEASCKHDIWILEHGDSVTSQKIGQRLKGFCDASTCKATFFGDDDEARQPLFGNRPRSKPWSRHACRNLSTFGALLVAPHHTHEETVNGNTNIKMPCIHDVRNQREKFKSPWAHQEYSKRSRSKCALHQPSTIESGLPSSNSHNKNAVVLWVNAGPLQTRLTRHTTPNSRRPLLVPRAPHKCRHAFSTQLRSRCLEFADARSHALDDC